MDAVTTDIVLAEHAAVIKALGKRVVGDVIEIGARLTECKGRVGHGNWLPWLDREFGWTADTAQNFMNVHRHLSAKIGNFPNLNLPVSSLYLLAEPSTPEPVRTEVIERAEKGEAIDRAEIARLIEEARADEKEAGAGELAKLRAEFTTMEYQLRQAQSEAASREAAVRNEYAGKLLIEPGELEAQIDKVVQPLQKKIEKYEEKLEKIREREKKEIEEDRERRQKASKPGKRRLGIDSKMSLDETGLRTALREFLAAAIKITPADVLKISAQSAKATEQTVQQWLGEAPAEARAAVAWLTKFIALTKGKGIK